MNRIYGCFVFLFMCVSGCATTPSPSVVPKPDTWKAFGDEIQATDLSFNMETGEIKYTLPKPAFVRVRIGIKDGGPLLRTFLDWQERPAGPQSEIWDKKDASGQVDYSARNDLLVILTCRVAKKPSSSVSPLTTKSFHPSPEFDILFPERAATSGDARPALRGVSPIRVVLSDADKKWLTETKYEMGFYIDNIFLFEDEEGVSPYTYLLNTQGINKGEHIITVNIVGYEGDIGAKSVKVYIDNATTLNPTY